MLALASNSAWAGGEIFGILWASWCYIYSLKLVVIGMLAAHNSLYTFVFVFIKCE